MMKTVVSIFCFLLSLTLQAQITEVSDKNWFIETHGMSYRVAVSGTRVGSFYYGPKLAPSERTKTKTALISGSEVLVRGGGVHGCPVLEAIFKDGVRDIELEYLSHELTTDNGRQTLRITQKDRHYPLQVSTCFRPFPEYDLIEKWTEVVNTGKKEDILIENLQSGALWLPVGPYELTQLSGQLRNEFQPQVSRLTSGVKTIHCRDFKSYGSSYFAVRPEGEQSETDGEVWYGQLHYSGNWEVKFDKLWDGNVQIVAGIRFWDTALNLKPGQRFTSPKMSYGYTRRGTEGVAQNYSAYVRGELLPKQFNTKERPVIYNSWYATEFHVNEEQQLALARVAKQIGVELFVIDDGWFKGRVNDRGGLGDWTVDKNKFPNGLTPLIKQINDLGMEFGIWVEPEMVNPNSDLYRAHPDWILHFPHRTRTLGRSQSMLNLAREDVYQYLHTSLRDLLKEHRITYLKWDMNRHLTEPGWPSEEIKKQREVRVRFIENLYRLVDTLKTEFPHVMFETCSSGGGRVDLGMFSRMDVAWASDNIDPLDRIYIQYAFLSAFPANTMVSWTGNEEWHKQNYSLGFRFDVAMSGVLGIGNDITRWGNDELNVAREKIALYKEIRPLVHNGIAYRLASPYVGNASALLYASADKSEAVLFYYTVADQLLGSSRYPQDKRMLKLRGLDPEKEYTVEGEKETFKGSYLMEVGIQKPTQGICQSRILRIREKR